MQELDSQLEGLELQPGIFLVDQAVDVLSNGVVEPGQLVLGGAGAFPKRRHGAIVQLFPSYKDLTMKKGGKGGGKGGGKKGGCCS